MNWLNLNIQTLDSENFLGSDPIDRATWLCLLRYCIGQENSGVISDCKDWGDRKWQQLVRITKKEATRETDLWSWDGETMTVWGYPNDKQDEVQRLRDMGRLTTEAKQAAAKANGSKGGRPKNPTGNPTETEHKPPLETQLKTHGKPIERKGKEVEGEGNEKGKEVEGNNAAKAATKTMNRCTLEEARDFAKEIGMPESDGEATFFKWQGNGWRNGNNPVKDWKATMRSWKAGGYLPSQKNPTSSSTPRKSRDGEYPQPTLELP